MRQGEAVACTCASSKLASGVAVVERCLAAAIRPAREAAVHRGAFVAHLAERSAVVEGDVSVVSAQHACVALNYALRGGLTCDVNICHDILDENRAISHTDECSEVNVRRDSAALNAKVANGGVLDGTEEAAPFIGDISIVIFDGVLLTVEDAAEPVAFLCNHHVGKIGAQVDIGRQPYIKGRITLFHVLGKPCKFFRIGNEAESIAID